MHVPHDCLSPAALRGVVEEFVTRDGTDDSSVQERIEAVLRQLEQGTAALFFDPVEKTCQVRPVNGSEPAPFSRRLGGRS
jgi:uncharacterized protein